MRMIYIYVLKSKKDGKWYTGFTRNLRERFKQHNNGNVFSTKGRGPFKLVYYEACENEQDATMREKYLKSGMGKRYLKNRLRRSLSLTGFTLIELMVSTGILAVIIIVAVGIYVYAIGSQQKSTANANLQEDGQNILAMISKDIRAMRLDYTYYSAAIPSPTSTLALIDDSDNSSANYVRIAYRYKSTTQKIERCKQVGASCDADNKFEAMNMSGVLIQRLDFYISPTSTPFSVGALNITSPRITIIMDLGSQNERFGQKTIRLEQTINPRYEEKE